MVSLAAAFAGVPDVDVESLDVADHVAALFDVERALVADAASARQRQFASGRVAAHRLLERAGVGRQPILRQGRAPIWSPGWVGSISHTETIALAALAPRARVAGLGIDVERRGRLTSRLLRMILTPAEIAVCDSGNDLEAALVIFSAKEAIYKSLQPILGGYIGFQDVEVDLGADRFRARSVGARDLAGLVEAGSGFVAVREDVVATLFRVPASAAPDVG